MAAAHRLFAHCRLLLRPSIVPEPLALAIAAGGADLSGHMICPFAASSADYVGLALALQSLRVCSFNHFQLP